MKLVVDVNEPVYVREIFKQFKDVEFRRLEVGDFWIADKYGMPYCIIERKTIRDLYSSLIDKRFERMLSDEVYENVPLIVIVHGEFDELQKSLAQYGKQNPYKIRGILEGSIISTTLRRGGSVIWLEGYGLKEVAKVIIRIRDKFEDTYRMPKAKRGDIRYLAKYFGISKVLLEKHLKKYTNVLEFLNKTPLKRVREVLDNDYHGRSY